VGWTVCAVGDQQEVDTAMLVGITATLLLAFTPQHVVLRPAAPGRVVVVPRMADSEQPKGFAKQQEIAKVTRTQASQGLGGFSKRSGGKKSERKAPAAGKGFSKVEEGLNFDRRPKSDTSCACGSGKAYGECCSPQHDGELAADPAVLVRARYTAFVYRLPDFLMDTTDPSGPEWNPDARAWKKSLLSFCDEFEFQGLESVSESKLVGDTAAAVSFRANFVQKGTLKLLVSCEDSSFVRDASGKWLYSSGEVTYEAQSQKNDRGGLRTVGKDEGGSGSQGGGGGAKEREGSVACACWVPVVAMKHGVTFRLGAHEV